ncbi:MULTISPECIES: aldo/keto reductase [Allofournierella]|uniref:aldo/keto reductase n=1 Tax=Allofournierella TaxID=1940255 RepID=UPI002E78372F|nr:aldo/keto reductase [Fournierella sp.]MEE0757398.1 aldo/keto reductase [Fournierella sp.]
MEHITLNNGAPMPMVGLGTWQLRGQAGERAILDALELGYRLLDTARMYENEDIVGSAVKKSGLPRREVFITTKLFTPSAGYRKAKEDIARSLEALQTDYIDLLLIHEPYEAAPEMYLAMEEACAAGLVRAVGLSNFSGEEYLRFLKHCRVTPAVDQVESHVYHPQLALKKLLEEKGTRMQAWASFTEGRRNIFAEPVLAEAGRRHGKTAAQTALRYLVENGIPVLPKSAHRERLRENLDIFDFSLTDEERRAIAALDEGRSLFGWF